MGGRQQIVPDTPQKEPSQLTPWSQTSTSILVRWWISNVSATWVVVHDEGGSWETNAYDTFFQAEGSSSTAFLGTECFWPGYESGMLVIQSETKQLREEGSQDKAKNSLWLVKCTQYLTSPAPVHSLQAWIYHEKLVHITMIKSSCLFFGLAYFMSVPFYDKSPETRKNWPRTKCQ